MKNFSSNEKTKINFSKIIQLIIFLGIGVFFVWFSVKDLSPEDIQAIKTSALKINNPLSWFFLSLSLLSGVCAHYIRGLRSIILIQPLGYHVRKNISFYSVMVCYLANLAFPRLGEVLRCTFLQRYERVPFQKALGTVVTERAIDTLCWLIMLIIVVLLNTALLTDLVIDKETGLTFGIWLQNKWSSLITNSTLFYLGGAFVLFCVLIYLTRNYWRKISFFVKIKNFFWGIIQGLISIKDLKHPFLFVLYTILIWVFFFLGTYFCFFAFDYLAQLGPAPAFTVLIIGSIGYMVAQGGLGAYPLIVAGVLVMYGINYNAGLAAGWIGWSVQTMMIIVFGIAALVIASLNDRKKEVLKSVK